MTPGNGSAVRASALGCPRCGGSLTAGADAALLRCTYCGYDSLMTGEEAVAASVPVGRIGRRRAASALTRLLVAQHVRGFAIVGTQLLYLPFWHLQLKLVGWQRYHVRRVVGAARLREPNADPLELPASTSEQDEQVEELIARELSHSGPACDARELGLLGIADRVDAFKLRPFDVERLTRDELACAVVHPLAVALRAARLYHAARLLPPAALQARQRLDVMRTRARLVYYPVYRVVYRSGGVLHWAAVDGMRGRVLAGSRPRTLPDAAPGWLAATAGAGALASLHLAVGIAALGAWVWWRLRERVGAPGEVSLGSWLTEELAGRRVGVAALDPTAGDRADRRRRKATHGEHGKLDSLREGEV